MERIQALIDRLFEQRQQHATPAQLLLTVQLLHSELMKMQQRNGTMTSGKVAVTLPVNINFSEEIPRASNEEIPSEQPQVRKPAPEYAQPIQSQEEMREVRPVKPREEAPRPVNTQQEIPKTFAEPAENKLPLPKEIHEVIAEKKRITQRPSKAG